MPTYTQREIDELIACPKRVSDAPRREMKSVGSHRRNDMKLVSSDSAERQFSVFMRQNEDFPENFSIGLKYLSAEDRGEITLLRCN